MSRIAAALERGFPVADVRWIALGAASAMVVGAAASVSTQLGIGVAVLVAVGFSVIRRPETILVVLIAAVFVELIKVGGVTISRVIAPIALLVVLLAASRRESAIRWAPPLGWAIAYSVWALASGVWTVSTPGTIHLLASLGISLVFMLAFASLLSTKEQLDRLLTILAVVSLTIAVFSIAAFIGRPLLGFGVLQEGRVQGGTGDPSFFAAAQLIALPLILVQAANARDRVRLAFFSVAAIVNIASVLSTVSRGGTISLVGVMLLLLILPARAIFRSRAQKTLVIVALVAGSAVFFTHYSRDLSPRLDTIFSRSQDKTGSGRLAIWPAAWATFTEHPVAGVGYGAFVDISVDRVYDTPNSNIQGFNVHPEEVHNVYLGTATELGIIGLTLFLGLLLSTALALRRTARRARKLGEDYVASVANALIVGLAGWAIGSCFIETETSRPPWIVIGICLALPKLLQPRSVPSVSSIPAALARP